jgi:hypothetical protein
MHGKTSPVSITGGVFQGLNNPLTVTRYHSLVIDPPTLPECFEVTARSESGRSWGFATANGISRACSSIRKVSSASRAITAGKLPQSVISVAID